MHDRQFMTEYFERHTAVVKRAIPDDRLLVYDVAEGWEPLCEFLNVPVPATPFPRISSRAEMTANMERPGLATDGAQMDLSKIQEIITSRLSAKP